MTVRREADLSGVSADSPVSVRLTQSTGVASPAAVTPTTTTAAATTTAAVAAPSADAATTATTTAASTAAATAVAADSRQRPLCTARRLTLVSRAVATVPLSLSHRCQCLL